MSQEMINDMLDEFEGVIFDMEQQIDEGTAQFANAKIPSVFKLREMDYLLKAVLEEQPDNQRVWRLIEAAAGCVYYLDAQV